MAPHRSSVAAPSPDAAPARQRSDGRVGVRVVRHGAGTHIADLSEAGPLRLRLPRHGAGPCEAVLLNTAGGIACGDRFQVEAIVDAAAHLVVTTTAAEKIYKSDGPSSHVGTRATLAEGARLDWLPQETILFDRARLERRFEADLAADARLLAFEAIVFGRTARDERLESGLFRDVWRIRRAGRLAYAESLAFDGPITALLERPALGGGARAMATLLDVSPDAEARLEAFRSHVETLGSPGVDIAASAWNGHLVARFLSADPDALRATAARVLVAYRGTPMPRVWQS
ncbi:urease accessory protein UreD [Methylobacterium marchantiae]|uniref:Urease accessory protein UreD n=1 Tax=Methylobacterium marchantiae TaxID=600331 RepID=A0ABW3X3K1_9HYPH|nr:Urease accessory protein UreD [Methylobacterium marchantiae]